MCTAATPKTAPPLEILTSDMEVETMIISVKDTMLMECT